MKIGELEQHCGECDIMEFCTDPFETPCICCRRSLKDIEEEEYKRIAENLTEKEVKRKIKQLKKDKEIFYDKIWQGAVLELVKEKLQQSGKIKKDWF